MRMSTVYSPEWSNLQVWPFWRGVLLPAREWSRRHPAAVPHQWGWIPDLISALIPPSILPSVHSFIQSFIPLSVRLSNHSFSSWSMISSSIKLLTFSLILSLPPSLYPFVHLTIYSPNHLFVNHKVWFLPNILLTSSLSPPSLYASIHSSLPPSIPPSLPLSIHPSIHPSIPA